MLQYKQSMCANYMFSISRCCKTILSAIILSLYHLLSLLSVAVVAFFLSLFDFV